jgi:hypothetical protein
VAKKKKPNKDIMEKARASRCFLETQYSPPKDDERMAAFLSIFHPNMDDKLKRSIISDQRK